MSTTRASYGSYESSYKILSNEDEFEILDIVLLSGRVNSLADVKIFLNAGAVAMKLLVRSH